MTWRLTPLIGGMCRETATAIPAAHRPVRSSETPAPQKTVWPPSTPGGPALPASTIRPTNRPHNMPLPSPAPSGSRRCRRSAAGPATARGRVRPTSWSSACGAARSMRIFTSGITVTRLRYGGRGAVFRVLPQPTTTPRACVSHAVGGMRGSPRNEPGGDWYWRAPTPFSPMGKDGKEKQQVKGRFQWSEEWGAPHLHRQQLKK